MVLACSSSQTRTIKHGLLGYIVLAMPLCLLECETLWCTHGWICKVPRQVFCMTAGIRFSIEDLEVGRFAHVAWVHSAMLDFRAVSDQRAELYNRVGDAFVAIHLWSPDSPVGQQVVLPFIQEFEPMLLGNTSSLGSGRAAFDPRYQTEEEAQIDRMLGLGSKDTEASDPSLPAADHQQGSHSEMRASGKSQDSHTMSDQAVVQKASEDPHPRSRRPHRRSSKQADNNRVGSN